MIPSHAMMQLEKVLAHEKVKPLMDALMAALKAEFTNNTPLAQSFKQVLEELSDVSSPALQSVNLGERMALVGVVNTLARMPLIKGK